MALVMVVSMVAVGGIAAQPAEAQSSGIPAFEDDPKNLDTNEFLVDDDFESDENDGDQTFETIGGALSVAEAGETIYVANGDYDESVLVSKSVSLVGEGAGNDLTDGVVLESDGSGPALEIQADEADVTGMTILGNGTSAVSLTKGSPSENVKNLQFVDNIVAADGGQIGLESEPMNFGGPFNAPVNQIRDNQFTVKSGASADTLVFVGGSAAGTGSQQPGENLDPGEVSFLIEDNEFTTDFPTTPGATGVSLHFEATKGIVTGNQFPADGDGGPYEAIVAGNDNEFTANVMDSGGFGAGLVLAGGSGNFLASENTIENAGGPGVEIETQTSDVAIDTNLIRDNTGDGVAASTVTDLSVTNNDIENNDGDGVSVSNSTNVTVASNTGIVGNGGDGVNVATSSNVDVLGNNANDNGGTGIYVLSSGSVLVEGNNAEENDDDGIWVDSTEGTQVLDNFARENGFGHGIHASGSAGGLLIGSNTVVDHDLPQQMDDPVGILVDNVETGMVADNEVVNNIDGIRVNGADSAVGIERNLVDGYERGIAFESYNTEDPSYAVYNALLDDAEDVVNNEDDTVEAVLNYYGTGPNASDLHDVSDLAQVGGSGDVIYDPFLTANPVQAGSGNGVTESGDVDTAGTDNTREYAHELTLEGDGDGTASDALTIAFPAPVDGTVGEVFADLPAGTQVFAYNASADQWVQAGSISNQRVSALDAFVVTGLEGGEEATVAFEYDNNLAPQGKNLEEGWNLVGAPQKNTVSTAFSGIISSENSQVNGPVRDASDMPRFVDDTTAQREGADLWYESTEDASGDDFGTVIGDDLAGADSIVSPYSGYWVLVDADDTGDAFIGAATSSGASASTEVDDLQTSQTASQLV